MQPASNTAHIPVDRIRVRPDHNPRKYFDPAKYARLVDSVRAEGVITAITVRGNDDEGYELIAGERRWRASREAGLSTIPATVLDVDDATAFRLSVIENVDRADLSIPEEAMAAQRLVDACDGDLPMAAQALGWTLPKLKQRLQLLHASPAVMQALMEDKIKAGHCELLSTLPVETQDKVLARVLDSGATIQMLKEQLEGVSLSLAQAKFSLAGCQGCPHNSETQASLFDTAIGTGKCTNRDCYTTKTRTFLDSERERLREEYPSVAFLTEKVPGRTIPLVMLGEQGVGPTQLQSGCRGCNHFGCTIDDRLGATTGAVDGPLCFERACHSERVAEYAAQCAGASTSDALDDDGEEGDEAGEGGATDTPTTASPPARAGTKAKAKGKAKKKPKVVTRATPTALVDQYQRVLRDTVVEQLNQGAVEPILALAVYGILTLTSQASGESVGDACKAFGIAHKLGGDDTATVRRLANEPKAALQTLLQQAAMRFFSANSDAQPRFNAGRINRRQLVGALIADKQWDMLPHMRVDQAFLETHTKAGLDLLMDESGFRAHYAQGDDGDKRFKTLQGQGKKDLIAGILGGGFDFSQYLPTALVEHQASLAKATTSPRR